MKRRRCRESNERERVRGTRGRFVPEVDLEIRVVFRTKGGKPSWPRG